MAKRKIWLLALPASLYVDDIKQLAKDNNLQIVDAKFTDKINSKDVEQKPPKVKLVSAKRKTKKKAVEPDELTKEEE